jgi:hypothetical protein
MIAGIAVDNWKLPIFKEHLDKAGFEYTEHPLTKDTSLLKVACRLAANVQPIVIAAEKECSKIRCKTCED